MPFSSATFSIRAVRREKRFSTSGGYPRDLEIVALALDPEAQVLKLVRQPHAKCRLEVRGIPLEFAELARFPAMFFLVPGRVEHEDMGVQLRIGQAIDGPGRGVDEFRPDHVAGDAVCHPGRPLRTRVFISASISRIVSSTAPRNASRMPWSPLMA